MCVGYVIKSYPRFSQTFIVNEILAHEAVGLPIEIFSLRPTKDGVCHAAIARVKAPVTYLPHDDLSIARVWDEMTAAALELPGFRDRLAELGDADTLDIYQATMLARAAAAKGITHLHAHFGNVATRVARLAAHLADLSYSFTAHARDIFHDNVVPEELSEKLADASAVITVSEYNLDYLRATFGSAAARVHRVYNGLDLQQFPYAAPRDRPARIICVGRYVEKKGFHDLLAACAILARRGRAFECLLVGSGPLEQALQAQIERLDLNGTVHMLGQRSQEEVKALIQDSAVLAAPCVIDASGDRDGLPTVLLEAMALGTPCVSTDVTGIPEVLRPEETGLMVPQHHPAALADALARLLDDAQLRVRLADRARALIQQEFDIHRNAARMREVFFGAPQARMLAS